MSDVTSPPWSMRRRVLVGAAVVLGVLVALAAIGWVGYALVYHPAIVVPRQRDQRRLYEQWNHLDYQIEMSEGEAPRRMHVRRADIVAESQQRFGKHPREFRDLPSIASGYYDR